MFETNINKQEYHINRGDILAYSYFRKENVTRTQSAAEESALPC